MCASLNFTDLLKNYCCKEVSGKRLKEILGDYSEHLITFTGDIDLYSAGLHVEIKPFEPSGYWPSGYNAADRIYFCHIFDSLYHNDNRLKYARQVILTDDMRIYITGDKMKADKMILGEKNDRQELITQLIEKAIISNPVRGKKILREILSHSPYVIRYIDQKFRTNDMMMTAIKNDAYATEQTEQKYRTNDMMIEAIKRNPYVIRFIDKKYRTHEMMTEAIGNLYDWIEMRGQLSRKKELIMGLLAL